MNPHFKFRTGKYAGQTIADIQHKDPKYLDWVKENQPKMLIEYKTKTKTNVVNSTEEKEKVKTISAIQPNMDFFNEKK